MGSFYSVYEESLYCAVSVRFRVKHRAGTKLVPTHPLLLPLVPLRDEGICHFWRGAICPT